MTATAVTSSRGRPFDPLLIVMAVGFVIAVGALAYPAFRADPTSAPGLVLIFTVGAVALIGLFAFARGESRKPLGDATVELLDAMAEPAALVWSTGQVLAFNGAWAEANGATVALPKGKSASALYMAFAQARAGEQGRAIVVIGDREQEVLIGQAGEGRFLVRAAPEAVLPVGTVVSPRHAATSNAAESRAMAAGAPFGSAVIAAEDLFLGKVDEPNAALSVLTGPAAARDAAFGHLFDPAGVAEARLKLDARLVRPDRTGRPRLPRPDAAPLCRPGRRSPPHLAVRRLGPEVDGTAAVAGPEDAGRGPAGRRRGPRFQQPADRYSAAAQSGLLERHPVGDPSYEGLNEIRQTAIRAADLVRKLLAFSRKSTVRRERLDLGELVGEFAVLLRRLLREDVRLETDYGRDLPVVLADKSQLETAVMNLAVNARDAMRGVVEPGAGVVTIRTARLTADEARLLGWSAAPTAAVALIEVADSGPGVPPELLDKIFEPFFTTKAVNEGTGMGLATVYGIVEQAGGHINVSNAAEGGAVFRIFLPEAAEAELAAVPVVEKVAKAPRDLSGAGRILFVEDEAAVRGIAARLLRQRGYEVIEAEDGEQALELAEQHAGTIDMMISDVIMPGLDGPALLKKARPYLGDAPVLFISGYAESDFSDLLQDEVGVSFLPKPLDIKTLAERVKQELHAG
jgi:two-component system cell cycle sensor histidine kinase/response regulator CckA